MSRDPELTRLRDELTATLDRMATGLATLGEHMAMTPVTFRADAQIERDIARFMIDNNFTNQAAAIRALIRSGIAAERARP